MTRAIFVLPYARARAAALLDRAPAGTVVEFRKARRTLDQNSLMWARLTDVAREVVWYGQRLSAEDWKDVFTAALRKARVVPGIDGGWVPLGMRTSDMTREEMSNLLDLMDAFAAQHGVTFREANNAD